MKIVIPGGTGQVGRILCRAFASAGDEVVVLSTIYAHRFDAPNDEFTGAIGGNEQNAPGAWRFSIDVAKAWEATVDESGQFPNTRIVIMRSAMIMSPDRAGVFARLLGLVRLGLGGPRRTRSAIHFVDSRVRFCSRHTVVDRQPGLRGSRKHLFAKSIAEFGIHARTPPYLGNNDRNCLIKLDAGGRRVSYEN